MVLAEGFQADQVGVVQRGDGAPAVEDLGVVVDGLDEPEDDWLAGAVAGVEEGAAALGTEETVDNQCAGLISLDGQAFVVVPESHCDVPSRTRCTGGLTRFLAASRPRGKALQNRRSAPRGTPLRFKHYRLLACGFSMSYRRGGIKRKSGGGRTMEDAAGGRDASGSGEVDCAAGV